MCLAGPVRPSCGMVYSSDSDLGLASADPGRKELVLFKALRLISSSYRPPPAHLAEGSLLAVRRQRVTDMTSLNHMIAQSGKRGKYKCR
jgi:hypothetical protein